MEGLSRLSIVRAGLDPAVVAFLSRVDERETIRPGRREVFFLSGPHTASQSSARSAARVSTRLREVQDRTKQKDATAWLRGPWDRTIQTTGDKTDKEAVC
jgi:hypothetical protein